jgi:hypothetical protein
MLSCTINTHDVDNVHVNVINSINAKLAPYNWSSKIIWI